MMQCDNASCFNFYVISLFNRATKFLFLSRTVFPVKYSEACTYSLCQTEASTRKQRKIPSTKSLVLWDKNFDWKLWHPSYASNFWYRKFSKTTEGCPTEFFGIVRPEKNHENWHTPLRILFWHQKLSEALKKPSPEFFREKKTFSTSFVTTPFCDTKKQLQKFSEKQYFSKTRIEKGPRSIVWYSEEKVFKIFWWCFSMIYWSLWAGQTSILNDNLFSACFGFRPNFFPKENSRFNKAVLFYSRRNESRANFVKQPQQHLAWNLNAVSSRIDKANLQQTKSSKS